MSRGFYRGKSPEQITIASADVSTNGVPGPSLTHTFLEETPTMVRAKGFTGNECTTCGSIHMVIAGHCEVCTDCGTSSGCS